MIEVVESVKQTAGEPYGWVCRELDLAGYLVKPITRTELADAARRALAGPTTALTIDCPPVPGPEPTSPSVSLRVLLAEDNLVNQKVAVRLLENQGHQVRVVADGRQAVAAMTAAYDRDILTGK
jgi:two-component system sensor histidine kinase/response regulator